MVVVVAVVVAVAGAGEAVAVDACTNSIEFESIALLVEALAAFAAVAALLMGADTAVVPLGLELGAGAGGLTCARATVIAPSNAAAPQTNCLRRVDIGVKV